MVLEEVEKQINWNCVVITNNCRVIIVNNYWVTFDYDIILLIRSTEELQITKEEVIYIGLKIALKIILIKHS